MIQILYLTAIIRYYFSHAYYENGGYEIEIAYTGE